MPMSSPSILPATGSTADTTAPCRSTTLQSDAAKGPRITTRHCTERSDGERVPRSLVIIVIVGALLRLRGIAFNMVLPEGFIGHWHPDEFGVVGWGGNLWPDLDPHYWGYPALHLYTIGALNGLSYQIASLLGLESGLDYRAFIDTVFGLRYLIARLVSVTAGCATIYLIGRRGSIIAGGKGWLGALGAAALLALSPLHIQHSHYGTVDPLFTLLCTASLLSFIRLRSHAGIGAHLSAGLLFGLTVSEKYNAVVLLTPYAVALFLFARHTSWRPWIKRSIAGLSVALVVALAINIYLFLHWSSSSAELTRNIQKVVFYEARYPDNMWMKYLDLLRLHVGHSLVALSILGCLAWMWKREAAAAVVATYLLSFYALLTMFTLQTPRYALPLLPVLLLLTTRGSRAVARALSALPILCRARRSDLVKGTIAGGLLLAAIAETAPALGALEPLFASQDTRSRASRWIEANVPTGTRIAIESSGHYGPTLDERRYDLIELNFLEGHVGYGKFIREVPYLLVGHAEIYSPDDIAIGWTTYARVIDATHAIEARARAEALARSLDLNVWELREGARTSDFEALLRLRPGYIIVTELMYQNSETLAFRSFYESLDDDPRCRLVKRFGGLLHEYSFHHPEILVYKVTKSGS